MNQERINKEVSDRLSRLEEVVFDKQKQKEVKKKVTSKSLSDHIISLRERGVFKQPLIPQEVHKELEKIYPCDLSRVKVELIRLQGRGQLRKASKLIDKKKYIAYVW